MNSTQVNGAPAPMPSSPRTSACIRDAQGVLWARPEERRYAWALRMRRLAHVLQISRDDDEWCSFAATARHPRRAWIGHDSDHGPNLRRDR